MGWVVFVLSGVLFAVWSYALAARCEKVAPWRWALCGFFFNVVPVIALYAAMPPQTRPETVPGEPPAPGNPQ